MDVLVEVFPIKLLPKKIVRTYLWLKKDISKKIGKFKKEVEEKMSKSSFTINQFISSVIINVDFEEEDGWKGDIIFYPAKEKKIGLFPAHRVAKKILIRAAVKKVFLRDV